MIGLNHLTPLYFSVIYAKIQGCFNIYGVIVDRDIERDLLHWKQKKMRMPLLLRGARQVGKSFIVEKFGRAHFDNLVTTILTLNRYTYITCVFYGMWFAGTDGKVL